MNFIPVNEPLLNGNEKKYLSECIDTGWISSEGPFVKKLEEEFATYSGAKYATTVSNGSAALDLAIKALKEVYNFQNNDEIILPDFTIISSAQSIVYNGLKPVFIDSEPITWNMDTSKIEERITPRTKAIMAVHIYGLPTDMAPILALAKKYNLKIIEDAAQAHGQSYANSKCGSIGDIATFSFYANKHITCGEGGMVMTSNEQLFEKCKYFKNLCFEKERFVHNNLGWNFRLSNLQAAVAYAQFEKLENHITIKKQMGAKYQELLNSIPAQLPCPSKDYAQNHYWVFGLVLDDDVPFNAKDAIKALAKQGIGTRPFFRPMRMQPVFQKMDLIDKNQNPIAKRLYERGFYIPSGLNLTDEKIEYVATKLKELF